MFATIVDEVYKLLITGGGSTLQVSKIHHSDGCWCTHPKKSTYPCHKLFIFPMEHPLPGESIGNICWGAPLEQIQVNRPNLLVTVWST